MGRAMNRSLTNVLFGAFGGRAAAAARGRRRGRRPGRCARSRADDAGGPAGLRRAGHHRPRLRPGGRAGAARRARARRPAREARRGREVRDPPGRRPHAGPHERAARRGERALRRSSSRWTRSTTSSPRTDVALVIGANDVVEPGGARRHRTARSTACRSSNVDQAAERRRPEAQHEPGLRRHRERALLRPEDGDALRRREGLDRAPRRRRQGRVARVRRATSGRLPRVALVALTARSALTTPFPKKPFRLPVGDAAGVGGGTGQRIRRLAQEEGYAVRIHLPTAAHQLFPPNWLTTSAAVPLTCAAAWDVPAK